MSKLARLLALPAATLLAGTGMATANPDIFVGGGLGLVQQTVEFSGDGTDSNSGHAFEGFASGAYNFTPVLGAQGDILVNITSVDFDGYTLSRTNLDGALHLFYRDSSTFLLGGFVQLGSSTYESDDVRVPLNRAYAGLEGQFFLDNFTLYGQAGLARISGSEYFDLTIDGYFASLEARYFLTPDFRIEAHIALGAYDVDPEVDTTTFNLGASAEYRLPDNPFSLYASYDFNAVTNDFGSGSITAGEHRFMIGAKFNFGTETLLERDRNGASLKPVTGANSPAALVFSSTPG